MKFGYLTISYKHILQLPTMSVGGIHASIGDYVQGMDILELYRKMGIPEKDIIAINFEDLAIYSGEDVILPINIHMVAGCAASFPPSPNILPVFLGLHLANHVYPHGLYDFIDYYKLFEPIGCRDYSTCNALLQRGVDAYVFGCSSIFFPKRALDKHDDYKNVYIIGSTAELNSVLRPSIKINAIYLPYVFPYPNVPLTDMQIREMQERCRQLLSELSSQAKLVITTRLHVSVPCVAMGIPVILGTGYCSFPGDPSGIKRYGWIKKIIPLVGPDNISKIDWHNPTPPLVDVETVKEQMMAKAEEAIRLAVRRYESGEFHALRGKILESTFLGFRHFTQGTFHCAARTIKYIEGINKSMDELSRKSENGVQAIGYTQQGPKYPKWIINLLACFIPKKKNRHHFRQKYAHS